jgi:hypothetical protein
MFKLKGEQTVLTWSINIMLYSKFSNTWGNIFLRNDINHIFILKLSHNVTVTIPTNRWIFFFNKN